jgi:hypothetical protein
MTKSGEDRAKKYAAKFDADVVRSRYAATKDMAILAQNTLQIALGDLAKDVRGILNDHSIPTIFTVPYMAFANKLYAIKRRFGTEVYCSNARDEAWLAICKWYTIGCLPSPLQDIWTKFAAVLGAAPSPIAFESAPPI